MIPHKYKVGQRLKIDMSKKEALAAPGLIRFQSSVVIVTELTDLEEIMLGPSYRVITEDDFIGMIVAERILFPLDDGNAGKDSREKYDGNTKISWDKCVWKPQEITTTV